MLLDERNYKAPPAIAQPSVAGFKAFCETKPKKKFRYSSYNSCAVGQYAQSLGIDVIVEMNNLLRAKLNMFALEAACTAKDEHRRPTYGDIVAEINKAGAA